MADSVGAASRYLTGKLVFDRLLQNLPAETSKLDPHCRKRSTQRVFGAGWRNLRRKWVAKLAGSSAGLWAAHLSHEIALVVRGDWACRYFDEKYLDRDGGATMVLGDPGLPGDSWSDSEQASADFGRFCRPLELLADREGLMLMAQAGYHPDFVPALHHLLHAEGVAAKASLYAMHPCWEERDRELSRAYTEASIEFARRWRDWYASPGGNPPVVVFAEDPVLKRIGVGEYQIRISMHCENLAGAVEVVLRSDEQRKEVMRLGRIYRRCRTERTCSINSYTGPWVSLCATDSRRRRSPHCAIPHVLPSNFKAISCAFSSLATSSGGLDGPSSKTGCRESCASVVSI